MNNIFNKKNFEMFAGVLIFILLFVTASYFSQTYEVELEKYIGNDNDLAKVIYVFITIFATVFTPISTIPLLTVVSNAWGWLMAGILSIIGWSIGAQIAFYIAHRFGKPVVSKLFSIEKLNFFENYFTTEKLFWFVVFLRMILPVDILSYALGLFSKMKSREYFFATLIGITPFAFIFAYAGKLSLESQMYIFLVILGLFLVGYFIRKVIKSRKIL